MNLYKDDGSDINLAICLSWYMDYEGVKRLYNSCKMNDSYSPQHFIAINGVYPFFKYRDRPTPKLSNDGSAQWLAGQNKVTVINYPGYEIDKRTQYLRKAEELGCDAIIIIDSDEYLHEDYRDWKEFRKWLVKYARAYDPGCEGIIFNMMSWIDIDYVKAYNTTEVNEFTLVPRVWHSPKNIEYYNGVHYWVRRKNSEVVGEKLAPTILTIQHGIRLAQDSKLRDLASLEARDGNNRFNIKHEDTLIKRYNNAHHIPYRSLYNTIFSDDGVVTTNLNPLLAITVNYYHPEIIENFKKIINVDKIYLDGFEDRGEALNKGREFFLEHEEYSHLILTSDFINVQRSDINKLIARQVHGVDIVTGYSISSKDDKCTFSESEVHFMEDKRKWDRMESQYVKNAELNESGFIEAKYTI